MVSPITGAKYYVQEACKSMKAMKGHWKLETMVDVTSPLNSKEGAVNGAEIPPERRGTEGGYVFGISTDKRFWVG
jgi:hypothetical protein